MRLGHAKG